MPNAVIPKFRLPPGIQPQYPIKLDRSHPFNAGIRAAHIPSRPDMASGALVTSTPPPIKADHAGKYGAFAPGNSHFYEYALPTYSSTVTDFCSITIIRSNASVNNFAWSDRTSGAGQGGELLVGLSGVDTDWSLRVGASGGFCQADLTISDVNAWAVIVAGYLAGTTYAVQADLSGNIVEAITGSTATGTVAPGQPLRLGRRATTYFSGDIAFFAYSDVSIDLRGMEVLARDPYQIFEPAVPFPVFLPSNALNNARISAMHFQRHYEPIAVGE